jgi:pyridoxamine 5'-phosphate oxidase family protein
MDRDTFTEAELTYLNDGRRLARIATVGRDGTPHVVPTGWTYNLRTNTIDVSGRDLAHTKKFRDVNTHQRAAIVIDDLASVQPWRPRAIEIRGRAEALRDPAPLIRIHPEHISSWGLEDL